MGVAGLVLAGGAGRRYGMPKALVRSGDRLWVERAADTLAAGGCDDVLVVLGAAADRVRATAPALRYVDNPDWPTGMASSLRAGLVALAGTEAVAAVILLVDMPGVTPAAVRQIAAHAGSPARWRSAGTATAAAIPCCSAAITGPGQRPPRPVTAGPRLPTGERGQRAGRPGRRRRGQPDIDTVLG